MLYLLNVSGQKVKTFNLEPLSRENCNSILLENGFYKKSFHDEVVPEEFANGPYLPHTEL